MYTFPLCVNIFCIVLSMGLFPLLALLRLGAFFVDDSISPHREIAHQPGPR